jgi:hypothetical protein
VSGSGLKNEIKLKLKMKSIVKFLVITSVISAIECGDCQSGVAFLHRNFTSPIHSGDNFTEAEQVIRSNVDWNELQKVILDNETSYEDDWPHAKEVPNISNYERGEVKF